MIRRIAHTDDDDLNRETQLEEGVVPSAVQNSTRRTNRNGENDVSCLTMSGLPENQDFDECCVATTAPALNISRSQSNTDAIRRGSDDGTSLSFGWISHENSQVAQSENAHQLTEDDDCNIDNEDDLPRYKDQTHVVITQSHLTRRIEPNFGALEKNTNSCIDADVLTEDSLAGAEFDDEGNIIGNNNSAPQESGQSVIPMVDAVVIGENNRTSLDGHIVQLEEGTCSAPQQTSGSADTRTTTIGSSNITSTTKDNSISNNNSNNIEIIEVKLREMAIEAARNERKFWLRIIVIAVALNTILVGGIVVGGFCASGKCRASDSQSVGVGEVNTNADGSMDDFSSAPTPTMIIATASPAQDDNYTVWIGAPTPGPLVFSPPWGIYDEYDGSYSPSEYETAPPILTDDNFINTDLVMGTVPPAETLVGEATMPPEKGASGDDTAASPCLACEGTVPPGNETSEHHNFGGTNNPLSQDDGSASQKSPKGSLIAIAVVVEAAIVCGLVIYYRRWKRQRARRLKEMQELAAANVSSTTPLRST